MKLQKNRAGFSLVEIILAAALFVIFASGAMVTILQGLDLNRLGNEQAIAKQYAVEGIEAIRSIKNQSFANLVNSTGVGISLSGGVWAFSGTGNTFEKYTRVLTVSDVQRDGSGNIVASGGTIDPSTKKITSTVNWNFTIPRPDSVTLSTYLTNWKAKLTKGGMLVYGNGGTTTDSVMYQVFDGSSSWTTPASVADVDTGSTNRALRAARVFASSTRNEKILISRHFDGTVQYIYGQVYNGTGWGNVQLLSSWTAGTFLDVQNFDGTYLNDGTFMVVFSDNTVIPKMRTWNGTVWSAQSSLTTLGASNIPNIVVAKARPNTNEVMTAFFTQASDSITQYWNGSAWSAITTHATAAPVNTKRLVDFDWSPNNALIGGLVYSSGGSDRALHIKIWTANGAGGGSWSAIANTGNQGTGGTRLGAMAIVGRSGADIFEACNANTVPQVICYESNFTPTWTNPTNQIIAAAIPGGIQQTFDIGFENASGTPAIGVYSDNTAVPKLKKYTAGTTTWDAGATTISTSPYTLGNPVQTVRVEPMPGSNDIMNLVADNNRGLYTVMWDGTNNVMYTTPSALAFLQHGTNGSAATDIWYDFAWDNF